MAKSPFVGASGIGEGHPKLQLPPAVRLARPPPPDPVDAPQGSVELEDAELEEVDPETLPDDAALVDTLADCGVEAEDFWSTVFFSLGLTSPARFPISPRSPSIVGKSGLGRLISAFSLLRLLIAHLNVLNTSPNKFPTMLRFLELLLHPFESGGRLPPMSLNKPSTCDSTDSIDFMKSVFDACIVMWSDKLLPDLDIPNSNPPIMTPSEEATAPVASILVVGIVRTGVDVIVLLEGDRAGLEFEVCALPDADVEAGADADVEAADGSTDPPAT